ncbi:MAG: hypothetical protein RLO51_16790 [Thalassobaculum sp.]|uniref:hypothetical protein n=1 Tax=Thalassobaculum sp. TaxID=2022740 RepID=UPI0032EFB92F
MPPDMKNPAAGDGRALRGIRDLADQNPEDTTLIDETEDWRRRVQADAAAFLHRKARRPRGRR